MSQFHEFDPDQLTALTRGDGGRFGAVAVFRDITERRRIEEAMRVRDRALASVDDGVVITDPSQPDNPVIYCNDAITRITGYPPGEIVGRNCRFLQGTDRDQEAREALRDSVTRQVPCRVLIRNYRWDGELFWNELSLSPVRDDSGRTTHFVGVLHDALSRSGLATASLWAVVPGYASQLQSPRAAIALVERACSMMGTPAPVVRLAARWAEWEPEPPRAKVTRTSSGPLRPTCWSPTRTTSSATTRSSPLRYSGSDFAKALSRTSRYRPK